MCPRQISLANATWVSPCLLTFALAFSASFEFSIGGLGAKNLGNENRKGRYLGRYHGMSSHLPAGPRLGPGRWVAGKRYSVRTFKHRLKRRARRAKWLSLLRQGRPRSRRPKGRHKRQEPLARLRSFQPSASCVSERRGSCKTSYFGRIVSWLCGWLGIRVGEATNPGPETDPQDGQLAQALLKVLHEFTHRTPKETKQAVDPGKKGKGGVRPKAARPSQPRLAHVLMQTLQAALTAG